MSTVIDANATSSLAVPSTEDIFYALGETAAPPAEKPSETPVETGAVKTEAEPEPADHETEPESPKGKAKSPRSSWSELRTRTERAEAERDLLKGQLVEERERKKAESLPATVTEPAVDPEEPDSSKYDDLNKFVREHSAWAIRKALQKREVEESEKAAKAASEKTAREREERSAKQLETWNAREAVIAAKHEDYNEAASTFLATAKPLPVLAAAVFESELGPDLALYLGAHPDELAKLTKMDERAMLKAIGKLEVTLGEEKESGSGTRITKAPRALKEVHGSPGGPEKEVSMEDLFYGEK